MCGICGFVGDGKLETLETMTSKLRHRGPDASGMWCNAERGIYLGHRRLAIIDLADGTQPMWTPDEQLGVIFNGEIYNHRELRSQLQAAGHVFQTHHSDTEVLLHAYRHWGPSFVSRLNGMWAFAILDQARRQLFLSRDRFGQKPLFYSHQNGSFVFGSELHALTSHPAVAGNICKLALKKYFAYGYIPAPRSLYEGVYKLPGGCSLVLDLEGGTHKVERYWRFVLEPFEQVPRHAERDWAEEIRRLLKQAVARRLMSDVPLGVFLSGGIDSASVAAYAAEICGAQKVHSFSIGFEEASFDETAPAAAVAAFLKTSHTVRNCSLEQGKTSLPEIAAKLDEPLGDGSLLPTYLLCEETHKYVTVALGGDGADELFAGYDPFQALKAAHFYSSVVPRPMHQAIRLLAARLPVSHRNMSFDFRLKRALRGLEYDRHLWNPVWLGPLGPDDIRALFQEPVDLEELYSEAIDSWDRCSQDNLLDKTLQFYTDLYLQDDILVKVDRAAMMHSLEVRTPYLDIDLVNFVRKIPGNYKFRNGKTKYILKKALAPILPHQTINRPKKGFGIPVGKWFQTGALSVDTSATDRFGLHSAWLEQSLTEHRNLRRNHRGLLWNLWLLDNMCTPTAWRRLR